MKAALDFAQAAGWPVFPCGLDKRPHGRLLSAAGFTRTEDGREKATWKPLQTAPAPAEILEKWTAAAPPCWGVATGSAAGIFILDFDGQAGAQTLARLGLRPHVITGRGGAHVYFKHPRSHRIPTRNGKGYADLDRLYPGLDIRADGGYAVLTGESEHGRYTQARPFDLEDPATLPEDLRRLLDIDPPAPAPQMRLNEPAPAPARPAKNNGRLPLTPHEWAETQLQTAWRKAQSAGRNNAGFDLCCQLRDAGFSEADAETHLLRYAAGVSPSDQHGRPMPYTEHEARATLRQVYSAPRREPARAASAPPRPPAPPAAPRVSVSEPEPPAPPSESPVRPSGRPCGPENAEYRLTELGNAERLIRRYGKNLRYCHSWKEWLCWNSTHWERDATAAASRCAIETHRALFDEASKENDADRRSAVAKWAMASQSAGKITATLDLARRFREVSIKPEQLDADPWTLNVENGTLDLRTATLRPHRREDLFTKCAGAAFDPAAECPTWEDFIAELMCGDAELTEFLQRALGYSLTGEVAEKCLFVCWGAGDNGKTTLLEAVRAVLGDYAGTIQIESLLSTRAAMNGREATPDIAELRGRRFVTTSETEDGARLNEARVKHLTGMATIQARHLYAEFFSFAPTHKLWMDSNYRPVVRGTDRGIWTRLKTIPFSFVIKAKDRTLLDRLRKEAAGILAWLAAGCGAWADWGLTEPAAVAAAGSDYRAAMDRLGHFLDECTRSDDPESETPARELYRTYHAWSRENGEEPIGERRFAEQMQERGHAKRATNRGRVYRGLRLSVRLSTSGHVESTEVFV